MGIRRNRIVVKVGTSTLTNENGQSNLREMEKLSRTLADIQNLGNEVVLVSSGAIAVGVNKMRLSHKPQELPLKQAAAAVGQCELMHLYDKLFGEYGKMVAQILFTSEDLAEEKKRENLSNTLTALLANGIIPIINENDSISSAEIESDKKIFGDNDMLSALVAGFIGAGKLIILSDIEGLFDSNPRTNPEAKRIEKVERVTDEIIALADGAGSTRGTGGMVSKLDAARYATEQGIDMWITLGANPEGLYDIVDGKAVGTWFVGRDVE